MKESIQTFEDYNTEVTEKANTPAKGTLFEVDPKSPQLDTAKSEAFHHIVSKLLYVSKRARVDNNLAIAFLCT